MTSNQAIKEKELNIPIEEPDKKVRVLQAILITLQEILEQLRIK